MKTSIGIWSSVFLFSVGMLWYQLSPAEMEYVSSTPKISLQKHDYAKANEYAVFDEQSATMTDGVASR